MNRAASRAPGFLLGRCRSFLAFGREGLEGGREGSREGGKKGRTEGGKEGRIPIGPQRTSTEGGRDSEGGSRVRKRLLAVAAKNRFIDVRSLQGHSQAAQCLRDELLLTGQNAPALEPRVLFCLLGRGRAGA
jgi:hypothetical protein